MRRSLPGRLRSPAPPAGKKGTIRSPAALGAISRAAIQGRPRRGEGPEDDTQPKIVTDLMDCVLTYDQLEEDVLPFYAYIANGRADMYLRVKLRNSRTPANGSYLSATGRNYQAELARQENNYITLYLKQGNKTLQETTCVIFYTARKADADNPEVGEHPLWSPPISTAFPGR